MPEMSVRIEAAAPLEKPKSRRRKEARPDELIDAATTLFARKGFAATKLEDVARRSGVSKGTVYIYFKSKEELFRAVARTGLKSRLAAIPKEGLSRNSTFEEILPALIMRLAEVASDSDVAAVARMVISESNNFPDLACIWREEIAVPILDWVANFVARAQDQGDACAGDPRLHAYSIIGPIVMALLYRDFFSPLWGSESHLLALAQQHARNMLRALLRQPQTSDAAW